MGPDANTLVKEENSYGSRKFILTAISLFVSAASLFTGFINGDQFVDIVPMILAIYGAGNVASYFAAVKGK